MSATLRKIDKFIKHFHRIALFLVSWVAILCGISAILILVYDFGFITLPADHIAIGQFYEIIIYIYTVIYALRLMFSPRRSSRLSRWLDWLGLVILITSSISLIDTYPGKEAYYWVLYYFRTPVMVYIVVLWFSIVEISKGVTAMLSRHVNPYAILSVSFMMLIFIGTGLLMVPNATHHGISFIDSLFTTTSAVCVTGLNAVPFVETFTMTGQVVVLLLIQAGGLGIMTITSFFGLFFMGQTSIHNHLLVRNLLSDDHIGGLGKTLMRIIVVTLFVESVGALCLYLSINERLMIPQDDKVFFAIFHAVSAFCNAGFSTMPNNLCEESLRSIGSVYFTISWLIIFGGIGFPIFANLLSILSLKIRQRIRKLRGRRVVKVVNLWNFNTKIVLVSTAILLVGGTLYFLIFEWNGLLAVYPNDQKIVQAFFNAVTPRTSGFNSVDMSVMSAPTLLVVMLLMWIGAAPQSTGGGIKVTTMSVLVLNFINNIRGRERTEIFRREISPNSISRAFATVGLSIVILFSAIMALAAMEPHIALEKLVFEAVSAIGTVGLSMGITGELSSWSKAVVVVLMFVGRIGVISLLAGMVRQRDERNYKYPEGNILIN